MVSISLDIDCKELKIVQRAQDNQLLIFWTTFVHTSDAFNQSSPTVISEKVNNNVIKDTPIHRTHLIPSFEHALTSAPYLAKTLTTSTCPLEQASWSGVHPALSLAFGSIPWWMWCRTVSYEKHTLPSNYKFIIIIYLHSAVFIVLNVMLVAPSKCLTQIT